MPHYTFKEAANLISDSVKKWLTDTHGKFFDVDTFDRNITPFILQICQVIWEHFDERFAEIAAKIHEQQMQIDGLRREVNTLLEGGHQQGRLKHA